MLLIKTLIMMYIYNMKKLFFISLLLPLLFFSQSNVEFDFHDDCGNENFGKPNRTYGGNNWYGGFSDHLPIYCRFEASTDIFTMFYNVENLFDTIDDPRRNDNSFLPNSKKKWNTERYFYKLEKLERVFSTINSDKMPNLIGLCEIENQQVIDYLLKQPFFSNHTFNIIHQESPDNRGIDCAILYDKEFSLIKSEMLFHSRASTRSTSPSLSMSPASTFFTMPISGNNFLTYVPLLLMKSADDVAIGNWPRELFPLINKSISPSPSISNATAALGLPV